MEERQKGVNDRGGGNGREERHRVSCDGEQPPPTILVHDVAIIMSLGLNWTQYVGLGWPPSSTVTLSPVSADQMCTVPS